MDNLWIIYGYGWWLMKIPSEKYKLVSWDDDIPNCCLTNKRYKSHVPVTTNRLLCQNLYPIDQQFATEHGHLIVDLQGDVP